ncbi:MAG: DegT/DnrJ/EryC1/StrS family aminotransferase [Gracilibacteraceae bacterium]|nr:DegT/DnrJ/EryC1/StrS family aminotransferase [Gracilibacteraceae bacterium]
MSYRIYLSSPHMGGQEMSYIEQAFSSNWIAPLGENVDVFEAETAARVSRGHGVALSAGTHAIHLALKLLGVGAGDTVFCSALTFAGSCNPILYERARPVFIDCEETTWNMAPAALSAALRQAAAARRLPKAVIVVDLYGQSADYDALLPLCREYGVPVIEDAAEAFGAELRGRPCGSFGALGVLSFNGNKIITTSGGGMLLTDDGDMAGKARFWATQARDPVPWYEHTEIGYNYRMSNILAGIGRGQLLCLGERLRQKKSIHDRYAAALIGVPAAVLTAPPGYSSTYWLSVLRLDLAASLVRPPDIIAALAARGIEARRVWKPMQLQPVYAACPFYPSDEQTEPAGISARLFASGVCLPSDTKMTAAEQEEVIDIILGCFRHFYQKYQKISIE